MIHTKMEFPMWSVCIITLLFCGLATWVVFQSVPVSKSDSHLVAFRPNLKNQVNMFFFLKKPTALPVRLTQSEWFTEMDPETGFGKVMLRIAGQTGAEKLSIRTIGTGEIWDQPVEIRPDGSFEKLVCYMIAVRPNLQHTFQLKTELKATRIGQENVIKLKSGKLKFSNNIPQP